jgi:hypothetical protein
MRTTLVALLRMRSAGRTREPHNRPIGATPEPYEGEPGRVAKARPRARPRRRRAWLFDVERRAAVLCSSAAYLLGAGAVMVLAYFAAHLVASWTFGPVN